MKVVSSIADLRSELAPRRVGGHTVAFVPTMGALHEGHLSLIRAARTAAHIVVVSIFVNPLQFGANEDFDSYPRDEQGDRRAAEETGTDLLFVPQVEEIYPPAAATTVSAGSLGTVLEGEDRPGHFDGVCTVVAKLFNIVAPDVAFFGQKDAQQVAVIRKMVADLNFQVGVEVCPTVREADGLALSSRNRYLSSEERSRATALYEALRSGRDLLLDDADLDTVEKKMWEQLAERGLQPSYARIVDPDTFAPSRKDGRRLLVVAARLGSTRLIDNLLIEE